MTDQKAKKQHSCNSQRQGTNSKDMGTVKMNMAAFIDSWKSFDRAGSCLVSSMIKDVPGAQLGGQEEVLGSNLAAIFSGSVSEQVLRQMKEIENLLTSVPVQEKVFSQVFLLFVKLQLEHHRQCTQSLTHLIEQLIHSCDNFDHAEILQQIKSLELHRYVPAHQSPSRGFGLKKSSTSGSNSPKTPKHSIKSSLFSLFERKNSPDEGSSSFYVDLNQQEVDETSQSKSVSHRDGTDSSQSEALIQLGLDPAVDKEESAMKAGAGKQGGAVTAHDAYVQGTSAGFIDSLELSTKGVNQNFVSSATNNHGLEFIPVLVPSSGAIGSVTNSPNGHVASQEELDSVINLLSGVGTGPVNHMSPIPEQQSSVSLQVPSLYGSLSPSTSDSCMDNLSTQRSKSQRRSEGCLDLAGFGNPGRNTWPNQHRSSLPANQLVSQVQYDYTNNPHSRNFMSENRPAMTLPPGGAGHFPAGYQWGFPDPKLNRTWPMNNLTGSGTWSAGQDSDDLSDDDSSGDHLFNISQPPPKLFMDDTTSVMRKTNQETGARHHSFEDLLDGRQSEGWQAPQQAWAPLVKSKEPILSYDQSHDTTRNSGYHRPVTMQWSDPLTSGNMWPSTGLDQQEQIPSQTVHGFGGQI